MLRSVVGLLLLALAGAQPSWADDHDPSVQATVEPLTPEEVDELQGPVEACWDISSLSGMALETGIVVGFDLTPDGRIDGPIRLLSATPAPDADVDALFITACQAILCGQEPDGFQLPLAKYEQWASVELTFDPRTRGPGEPGPLPGAVIADRQDACGTSSPAVS